MAYLCVSGDCALRPVLDVNETTLNDSPIADEREMFDTVRPHLLKNDFVIPDYVCCVLTEGVWTIFGASLLILGLFTIATLKYFKKYLAKTKYIKKNLRMKTRSVSHF